VVGREAYAKQVQELLAKIESLLLCGSHEIHRRSSGMKAKSSHPLDHHHGPALLLLDRAKTVGSSETYVLEYYSLFRILRYIVSPVLVRNSMSQFPVNQVGDHEENMILCHV